MNIQKNWQKIKNIDNRIYTIMKNGIKFSFVFCLIASLVLVTYIENYNPHIYSIGVELFKSGLFFFSAFIMCGVAFNKIIKDIN